MRLSKIGVLVLSTVALAAAPGGLRGAEAPDTRRFEVLRNDLEPFRAAFDAAADHVRAVLLVGPT